LEVVPAEILSEAAAEAVIVDPLSPKLTPFELLNVMAERLFEVVPADTLMAVRLVAIEPVMVEPLRPKLTPFELLNVTALRLFEVVPAEKLILPCVLATVAEAVMVEPLSPKLTLLELENVTAERLLLVVPADTLILERRVPFPLGSHMVSLAVWLAAKASAPPEFENPTVTVEAALLPTSNIGPR
jgi:hypothetical protein